MNLGKFTVLTIIRIALYFLELPQFTTELGEKAFKVLYH